MDAILQILLTIWWIARHPDTRERTDRYHSINSATSEAAMCAGKICFRLVYSFPVGALVR